MQRRPRVTERNFNLHVLKLAILHPRCTPESARLPRAYRRRAPISQGPQVLTLLAHSCLCRRHTSGAPTRQSAALLPCLAQALLRAPQPHSTCILRVLCEVCSKGLPSARATAKHACSVLRCLKLRLQLQQPPAYAHTDTCTGSLLPSSREPHTPHIARPPALSSCPPALAIRNRVIASPQVTATPLLCWLDPLPPLP